MAAQATRLDTAHATAMAKLSQDHHGTLQRLDAEHKGNIDLTTRKLKEEAARDLDEAKRALSDHHESAAKV